MARPDMTPILVRENEGIHGRPVEEHESWLLVRVNRVTSGPPGRHLFQSEMGHQHFVRVTVERCKRERDLNRDWLFTTGVVIEWDMTLADWGGFLSSFGNGQGVPATLTYFNERGLPEGLTPEAPHAPRLAESHREVMESGKRATEKILAAAKALEEGFENKVGRVEMRKLIAEVKRHADQTPGNMKFAAESLTEHVEEVVSKARGDIETMVMGAIRAGEALQLEEGSVVADRLLGPANAEDVTDVEVIEESAE